MKKTKLKSGFTLVELLAVIVILAIILVIAVPKVMSVIEDAKKATLESTAKMIASQAEKQKVQNTVLGNEKAITCEGITNINKEDYPSCEITFDNNTAKVTIVGGGKFEGLWVCDGTKTNATAQSESCNAQAQNIEVNHPLFLAGQTLTLDKFEVTVTYSDGSKRVLEDGTRYIASDTAEATTISSPNWPNNYDNNMTEEENYWEATYEGAEAIQITFDATSETQSVKYDWIAIYDENGNQVHKLGGTSFAIQTYTITGDYVKVTMKSNSSGNRKGFSATIKPVVSVPAEYTISPSVVPNTEGNFDITITLNEQGITKKISTKAVHDAIDYVASLEPFENDVVQTSAEYNGTTYDAGIRYVGEMNEVKNKVYYNCEDTDASGIAYGETNYDYANSCEVWRIIGVFDTKSSASSDAVPRVKIINTASTFQASWDSSASTVNKGRGINEWSQSDIKSFLNGYYIGTENSTCTYCDTSNQTTCVRECTAGILKSRNTKPLTTPAKRMIGNAVWDTYGVNGEDIGWGVTGSNASSAYLQEKGISTQYTGKICTSGDYCNDSVERTTRWEGLVGLMSVADIGYADGWLYNQSDNSVYPWSISPGASSAGAFYVWDSYGGSADGYDAFYTRGVWASVYLKSDIQIIGGDGDTVPYKLKS